MQSGRNGGNAERYAHTIWCSAAAGNPLRIHPADTARTRTDLAWVRPRLAGTPCTQRGAWPHQTCRNRCALQQRTTPVNLCASSGRRAGRRERMNRTRACTAVAAWTQRSGRSSRAGRWIGRGRQRTCPFRTPRRPRGAWLTHKSRSRCQPSTTGSIGTLTKDTGFEHELTIRGSGSALRRSQTGREDTHRTQTCLLWARACPLRSCCRPRDPPSPRRCRCDTVCTTRRDPPKCDPLGTAKA